MKVGVQAEDVRVGPYIVEMPVQRTFFTFNLWGRGPRRLIIGLGFYYLSVGV